MERREFMVGMGAMAASAMAAGVAFAEQKAKTVTKTRAVSAELKAVRDTTAKCIGLGETCMAHCTDYMEVNHKMADCQRAVMNMLAVCEALNRVAHYNNSDVKMMKALAANCADYCNACAKECEPHAAGMEECKACMDACKECAKACEAFVKAKA